MLMIEEGVVGGGGGGNRSLLVTRHTTMISSHQKCQGLGRLFSDVTNSFRSFISIDFPIAAARFLDSSFVDMHMIYMN
jgi:hypothetical protein